MIEEDKKVRLCIFGVGSNLDQILLQSVQMAAAELNLAVDIKEIHDIDQFMKRRITAIPAMAIEDEVIINGRVPSVTEIKSLLRYYIRPLASAS